MRLVMSSEFTRRQGFKFKNIERLIYVRNLNEMFNKERPIENTVEINISYKEHRKRTEIDVIEGQVQNVILEMPWLAHHNTEIDWKTGEVKMMRCLEECGKQQRPKQGKSGQQRYKEEEIKEEEGKVRGKRTKENRKQKEKLKKKKTMEVKKVAKEWEIWDEEEEVARSEEEAKKLVPEQFHKQIKVFGKKASEKVLVKKM